MKEQLHKLMEAEGLSPARFADEIGVQRSSISHILSGRNKPSYDFLMKILERFKGINAEWLLTGKGNMIKSLEMHDENAKRTAEDLFVSEEGSIERGPSGKRNEEKDSKNINTHYNEKEFTQQDKDQNKQIKSEINDWSEFTNVNNIKFILVFYEDGSFSQFSARKS